MQVDTRETAIRDLAVLHDATVVFLTYHMNRALLEVDEARVRHLHVRINRDAARCLIGVIADEFAADQVD